jgi:hypothetical protein
MLTISFSKDKDIKALRITNPDNTNKQLIYSRMLVSDQYKIITIDRSNNKVSVNEIENLFKALEWLKES